MPGRGRGAGPRTEGARRRPRGRAEGELVTRLRVDGRGARPAARTRASPGGASHSSSTGSRCPGSSSRCARPARRSSDVPVYRWMPPEDIAPVDRLIDATLSGGLDAADLHQRPRRRLAAARGPNSRGVRDALLEAMRGDVLVGVRGPGDGAAAAGPRRADGAAGTLPAGPARAAALRRTARPRAGVAAWPGTGSRSAGAPSSSTAGCGRCSPREWRCCGAGPPPRLGGPARRAAARAARRGTRRARGGDRDGPAARRAGRPEADPDRRQARLPAVPRRARRTAGSTAGTARTPRKPFSKPRR